MHGRIRLAVLIAHAGRGSAQRIAVDTFRRFDPERYDKVLICGSDAVSAGALQAVDTEGVEPMSHPADARGQPQADRIEPFASREALLSLTEHAREGFFVVPRLLDGAVWSDEEPETESSR